MATTMPVKIGLIGGEGGAPRDIPASQLPRTLEKIEIWSSADGPRSAGVIKGIRFTYVDTKGVRHVVPSLPSLPFAASGMPVSNFQEVGTTASTVAFTKGARHVVPSVPFAAWGMPVGNYHEFKIATGANEYVRRIDGTTGPGPDGDTGITSLRITTSTGKTETYGDPCNGTAFSVPLDNAGIFAFFANSDTYLNALGFYTQPYP